MKDVREVRRKEMKSLWMERLEIASEQCGLPSARALCEGLAQSNIALNKNMLQILSIYEPRTFSALVDLSKQYHLEKGVSVPNMSSPQRVITQGLLTLPVVPGNRNLYE
ncbi:Cysteine protease atg4c [Schistosoma haematobium]|nr:Cysteine protease atg4c [Schistosoma haematobium]KAH9595417.1 Cysteine protease atg4c [Schistosoma haematobium]